jgi:prepilin peptidase CpaA
MEAGYWQIALLAVVPAVAVASIIDYRAHKVPNWLNAVLAAGGLLAQGYFFGWPGVGSAVLGILVGLGVLIVPWVIGGMGAGDVKLMAAIGAWFGPWMTLVAFCVGAIIGGAMAVAIIVVRRRVPDAWLNLGLIMVKMRKLDTALGDFASVRSLGSSTILLPYGIPLSIGSVIVLMGQCFGWWVL